MPLNVVTTIMAGVLHGLHAAHEARTEQGEPLAIVHRDVSPQNVLVGVDGVPRVLDFGVAKAAHRAQSTREGQVKGKIAYMAPEQLRSEPVDRRCDVFAAAAVLWEAVTCRRLYQADSDHAVLAMVLLQPAPSPRTVVPDLDENLERIIMRGLERDREARWPSAREMAIALETCLPVASASVIGGWVERLAGDALANRAKRITDIESSTSAPVAAALPAAIAAAAAANAPAAIPEAPRRAGPDEVTASAATLSGVIPGVRSRPRWLLPALAAAVLLLGGGAFLLSRGGPGDPTAAAATARATASAEPPKASASPPAASAAPPPATAASAAPPPSASAAAQPKRPSVAPQAAPRPAAPPRGASCSPPYTVDAQGIRHMKPECL
jgi:serine/threonine-protein kinase